MHGCRRPIPLPSMSACPAHATRERVALCAGPVHQGQHHSLRGLVTGAIGVLIRMIDARATDASGIIAVIITVCGQAIACKKRTTLASPCRTRRHEWLRIVPWPSFLYRDRARIGCYPLHDRLQGGLFSWCTRRCLVGGVSMLREQRENQHDTHYDRHDCLHRNAPMYVSGHVGCPCSWYRPPPWLRRWTVHTCKTLRSRVTTLHVRLWSHGSAAAPSDAMAWASSRVCLRCLPRGHALLTSLAQGVCIGRPSALATVASATHGKFVTFMSQGVRTDARFFFATMARWGGRGFGA